MSGSSSQGFLPIRFEVAGYGRIFQNQTAGEERSRAENFAGAFGLGDTCSFGKARAGLSRFTFHFDLDAGVAVEL